MQIDWTRCAQPQRDHYDTHVLTYLDTRAGWVKHQPPPGAVVLADTIQVTQPINPHQLSGPYQQTQEWANAQTPFLINWPEGYHALQHYLDEFWTWHHGPAGKGCSSGHMMIDPAVPRHLIYVTSTDLQGCAQGIYHETGHLRLESFGLYIEHHDGRLLKNAASELFDSSVRKDCKRPMSAVLHGVYAWLMFTENDYHTYLFNHNTSELHQYALHNIVKIEEGCKEIQRHARWTTEGTAFVDGVFQWADDLCARVMKTVSH